MDRDPLFEQGLAFQRRVKYRPQIHNSQALPPPVAHNMFFHMHPRYFSLASRPTINFPICCCHSNAQSGFSHKARSSGKTGTVTSQKFYVF